MDMPNNPILLMSLLNTMLRDEYDSLDSLCEDRDLSKEEIIDKLKASGYEYMPEVNQFR